MIKLSALATCEVAAQEEEEAALAKKKKKKRKLPPLKNKNGTFRKVNRTDYSEGQKE